MNAILRPACLAALVLSVGCAPQYVGVVASDPQDVPRRQAAFAANPEGLDIAFKEGCNSPGDTFSRPDRKTARCNITPTPESAAFLLIEFDALLEAPKLIVQKITETRDDCYFVEMSYFAQITAKSGNPQRVYIRNRNLDRQIDLILSRSGGRLFSGPEDTVKCAPEGEG